MNVAYVRVSTLKQIEDRQIEGLKVHGIDKWYEEKVSAKDKNRPELKKMLEEVQDGDTIYVHDFSRLARNTKDLLEIVELLQSKNVNIISNKEHIDTNTNAGKLMLTMFAAIYEFERTNMLERQAEAIAVAKEKGTYRHRGDKKIDEELYNTNYALYSAGELTKVEFAKNIGVSRPTLDKILNKRNGEVA